MDRRERHFGSITTPGDTSGQVIAHPDALIRRLLLFEHCILESSLEEIPALVQTFGVDGLIALLESGAIGIVCDAMTAGQFGQTDLEITRRRGGPLPLGSYRIGEIRLSLESEHRQRHTDAALQRINQAQVNGRQAKKLRALIEPMLTIYPLESGKDGMAVTKKELNEHNSNVWAAIRSVVLSDLRIDIGTRPAFEVVDLGNDGDFRIDTSLVADFGIPVEQAHKLVEKAILGVAGLNIRLVLMRDLEAVTGFRGEEFPFFESKLEVLMAGIEPNTHEERFDRVIEIGGLPDLESLAPGHVVDARELLRIRETDECRDFRHWLRNIDSETEEEINERFDALRGQTASILESRAGRITRFAITTGLGFIPIVGGVLGPTASAVDGFLVDKIIGHPGPTAFLSHQYRSIFP